MQSLFWSTVTLCCLASVAVAQIPPIRAGSIEALRAGGSAGPIPSRKAHELSLHEIAGGDVKPGSEGELTRGDGWGDPLHVIQVVDDANMIVQALGKTWWIEMPTEGIVDDSDIRISGKVFTLVGTKRYDTSLGTKTVYHLKYVREYVPEPVKRERNLRQWTDKTGQFTVWAEFSKFDDGKVVLVKKNDAVLRLDPKDLSAADVKWYREELKARVKATAPEKPPRR